MATLYLEGKHLREIGAIVGRSHEGVRRALQRQGVPMRPRSSSRPKRGLTPLQAEVLADLENWPDGATVDDLMDWLGESREAASAIIMRLFSKALISVRVRA